MAATRLIISNTTPLINFAEIGAFDLLEYELGPISVPPAVIGELSAKADRFSQASQLARSGKLTLLPRLNSLMVRHLMSSLHRGEAQCIAAALVYAPRRPILVMDDSAARAAAAIHGIPVIGTPGVLLAAKRSGRIPLVEPLPEALKSNARFWISSKMWTAVLNAAGELNPSP